MPNNSMQLTALHAAADADSTMKKLMQPEVLREFMALVDPIKRQVNHVAEPRHDLLLAMRTMAITLLPLTLGACVLIISFGDRITQATAGVGFCSLRFPVAFLFLSAVFAALGLWRATCLSKLPMQVSRFHDDLRASFEEAIPESSTSTPPEVRMKIAKQVSEIADRLVSKLLNHHRWLSFYVALSILLFVLALLSGMYMAWKIF